MPNNLQCKKPTEGKTENDEPETLNNRIRELVIHAIGTPINLRNVQVRKVWNHHYRVNVIVGVNGGSLRIANSYFLKIDCDGSLIAATPKVTRQY
jgi:hypothetical protein